MKTALLFARSAIVLAAASAMCGAQDTAQPTKIEAKPVEATMVAKASVKWTNPDFQRAGEMLSGAWKTSSQVESPGASPTDVVIFIAPVGITGLTDTLYVEMARADGINRPYRQCVWRFAKVGDKTHVQTFEFRKARGEWPSAIGLWAAPSAFPTMSVDNLASTMEIEVKASGDGWSGKSPTTYPTAVGGATHMSSELSFGAGKIQTADRGFDAAGKQVWGPPEGKTYSFAKFDSGVKARMLDGGLVAVDYPGTLTGEAAKQGEVITLTYAGYLENGDLFDSSFERGTPFSYTLGVTPMLSGWNAAMVPIQAGMKRRLIIPSSQGYGARARNKIPANSTLYIDIDVLKVEPAPPAPADGAQPPQPADGSVHKMVPKGPPTKVRLDDPSAPKLEHADPPPEIKKKMEEEIARRAAEHKKEEEAKKNADPASGPKR